MEKYFLYFYIFFIYTTSALSSDYPKEWWAEVPRDGAPTWEILPQDAKNGEVVLSKRTELGIFSNLSYSPIIFRGQRYNSIEGLWQMMKYPEGPGDIRSTFNYPLKRDFVAQLYGFDAKEAGKIANKIMRKNDIQWITFSGKRFNYKDYSHGSSLHYHIIYEATQNKILQNTKIKNLLLKTKGLILIPDHYQGDKPESYYYHKILMKIRDRLI